MENRLIIIKGAGDLASGVALRLFNSGYRIIMTECQNPSSIRRTVSFSSAVYNCNHTIEGVEAIRAKDADDAVKISNSSKIAVLVDPEAECVKKIKPQVLIDAIMAKKNLGTYKNDAALVIALGPGFEAGVDAHYVIETKRSHYLGRIIKKGFAIANTGIPGNIGGYSKERVIHSTNSGILHIIKDISSHVEEGETIATIDGIEQKSKLNGIMRGMIQEGFLVPNDGFKIADVDPREESSDYINLVSDKALAIAGGVLECILSSQKPKNKKDNSKSELKKDMIKDTDKVLAYTDGSYNIRTHEYAYGIMIINGDMVYEDYKKFEKDDNSQYRNVAGELHGAMAIMKYCMENNIKQVDINYDYEGIEKWCTGEWKAKNKLTQEYVIFYNDISKKLTINFNKVKAHSSDLLNQRVDKLAALAFE